ncbi:MAG: biopolymer transporter ExbD [Planctomycetota bacterium]
MRKLPLQPPPTRPNLTPMVDITFLMLVFFIGSMKFVTYEGVLDSALPKDRGVISCGPMDCRDRLDFLLFVADPGVLVDTGEGRGSARWQYQGRRIRVELGAQKFFFDPFAVKDARFPVPGLAAMLDYYQKDMQYTPVSIDARKGVVYGDVIPLFDYLTRLKPGEISFAGTFEND